MTYPDHWPKTDRDCRCGDCDWTGQESGITVDVFEAHDLFERLEVGHPLPAGECPECGAWVYVVTPYSLCHEAAPELLEALTTLVSVHINPAFDANHALLDEALAAIAKATGKASS